MKMRTYKSFILVFSLGLAILSTACMTPMPQQTEPGVTAVAPRTLHPRVFACQQALDSNIDKETVMISSSDMAGLRQQLEKFAREGFEDPAIENYLECIMREAPPLIQK